MPVGGRPIGRSRKLILWIAGLTTAALCGLLLWGAGILNVPTQHVAMPPANASPEEVVRVYLAAQNAGDVGTMNAMVVDDHMRHSRSAGRWVVTDIDISPAMAEGLQGTRAEGWTQAVHVDVSFFTRRAPDITIQQGVRQPWGYLLVRNTDSERWRIIDQGI